MASCFFPDIVSWIENLPPLTQWSTNSMSLRICSSNSLSQPSLTLSISKNNLTPTLSILENFNIPISLWTSKPLKLNPKSFKISDTESTIPCLLFNFIEDILHYGTANKNNSSFRVPKLVPAPLRNNIKDMFNFSFLTLSFLICIYEASQDIRSGCLVTLKNNLTTPQSKGALKLLMRFIGSNLEEQWMRTVNLAITNWIVELKANTTNYNHPMMIKTPSPLFSYAFSTSGLWKVQLYCPVIAMDMVNMSNPSPDERLNFSLNYHQLEGVILFNYKVVVQETWVDLIVDIDNIRLDVVQLVNETLLAERGAGAAEKLFPSRIQLQLTPIIQGNIISVSLSKSSGNPETEVGKEMAIEGTFETPTTLGISVHAGETMTMNVKAWKFENYVRGSSANLNWFLHNVDGREVCSSKPSKKSIFHPNSWLKHRYSRAHRPFTREGGVVFAGDVYGERVWWKLCKGAIGKTLEWEIKGWIWLSYWPNKHRTLYNETRKLEFRDILHVNIS